METVVRTFIVARFSRCRLHFFAILSVLFVLFFMLLLIYFVTYSSIVLFVSPSIHLLQQLSKHLSILWILCNRNLIKFRSNKQIAFGALDEIKCEHFRWLMALGHHQNYMKIYGEWKGKCNLLWHKKKPATQRRESFMVLRLQTNRVHISKWLHSIRQLLKWNRIV